MPREKPLPDLVPEGLREVLSVLRTRTPPLRSSARPAREPVDQINGTLRVLHRDCVLFLDALLGMPLKESKRPRRLELQFQAPRSLVPLQLKRSVGCRDDEGAKRQIVGEAGYEALRGVDEPRIDDRRTVAIPIRGKVTKGFDILLDSGNELRIVMTHLEPIVIGLHSLGQSSQVMDGRASHNSRSRRRVRRSILRLFLGPGGSVGRQAGHRRFCVPATRYVRSPKLPARPRLA